MAAFAAARSAIRSSSTFTSARTTASKFASAAASKPKASPSPFRIPAQKPLSHRVFRSPVEMSAISMLPFHTATASALLNSLLSAAPRTIAWTLEGD